MLRSRVTWAVGDAELSDAEDSAVARLLSVEFHPESIFCAFFKFLILSQSTLIESFGCLGAN